ncbi:MAG TPA: hypothetical protein VJ280_06570 [Dehalococcoidales bacterium]|jgi:uncharacterized membrane protein YidH (DUF202 family)|nr:hypothetical protein [Dehalococcoidales bacterium]
MPSKKSKSSPVMTRIKAAVILIAGIIILVLGIGMWQSPEVDWAGFMGAWGSLGIEFSRLRHDPFAVLGILVIIVGVIISYAALKRLIRGKSE